MITETQQITETPEPQALKDAVRKFWGTVPCGVSHSSQPTDSHAFSRDRKASLQGAYEFDKPFLKEAINFTEHTGKTVFEVGVEDSASMPCSGAAPGRRGVGWGDAAGCAMAGGAGGAVQGVDGCGLSGIGR